MSVRSLFCAVRSQLHFSQLAAWLSASGGARPRHVCYRLALPALSEAPGAFAASRFLRPPLEHVFPPAPLAPGGPALQVSVKMLPRMDALPILVCPLHSNGETPELTPTIPGKHVLSDMTADNKGSSTVLSCDSSLGICGSDSHLGDSLLDPPPSLHLLRSRTPRTNSPPSSIMSRGGETSNAILLPSRTVRTSARWRDGSPPSPPSTNLPQRRRGRQGMARRRDTSSGGLSSLRGLKSGTTFGDLLDDRMQNPCTRPGKHHCRAYEDDNADCGSSLFTSAASPSTSTNIISASEHKSVETCASSQASHPANMPKTSNTCQISGTIRRKLSLELSQSEVEEVLAVLRDRNLSTRPPNICSKGSSSSVYKESDSASVNSKFQLLPPISMPQECNMEVYHCKPSTSTSKTAHKADLLLDAILRTRCSSKKNSPDLQCCDPDDRVTKNRTKVSCNNNFTVNGDKFFEAPKPTSSIPLLHRRLGQLYRTSSPRPLKTLHMNTTENHEPMQTISASVPQTISASVPQTVPVPSAQETALFRRSLRSAACMVFHCRTGLPLTSSPAPVSRGHDSARFDFDSSLNSVSAIRSALFEGTGSPKVIEGLRTNGASRLSDDSEESTGSPGSPGLNPKTLYSSMKSVPGPMAWPPRCHLSHCSSLLGSFEESVLNGRLEPVSTVQGFTADLGASGTFCPRHLLLPVTVFFYTLGDNDKVSTPYLGHINLGKKGYTVPRVGTIQVTLFNPLGTVVKMFVVQYDLSDMPPQATTFLRQRTLYLPAGVNNSNASEGTMHSQALQKHLRYLIHLRFSSSRSGRISLHTDIRMIIFRKSDLDTATAHGGELAYELRSFTHGPTNPKFSPRK